MARKLDVLREHCAAEGRDYDSIAKTVLAVHPALADPDAFLADAAKYAALGVTEMEAMPDPWRSPVEFAEQIAERIAPAMAQIGGPWQLPRGCNPCSPAVVVCHTAFRVRTARGRSGA